MNKRLRDKLRPTLRFVRREILPSILPARRHVFPSRLQQIRIVGLLSSASGIGKSARLCLEILNSEGYELSTKNVSAFFNSDDNIAYINRSSHVADPDLTIYHVNPTMLLPAILSGGLKSYYRSYNAGYWAWELECLPREWIRATRFLDLIMVPSNFCKAAVERSTQKPVLVVPHPVSQAQIPLKKIQPLEKRQFRVLNVVNFGSSFKRKNPLGLLRAFQLAFPNDPNAELVFKTSQGHRYLQDKSALVEAARAFPNVHIIDDVWDEAQIAELFVSCDVYASLHRSEGFGLTLAEAIMYEIPVVATNWSGNTDFLDNENAFPVDFQLIRFDDTHSDYQGIGEAYWAEPSVTHAATQLQYVRNNPDVARAKSQLAKKELIRYLDHFSYAAAFQHPSITAINGIEKSSPEAGAQADCQ